jgi:pSer/pThr/pTyr-binding forkhead associated (FHA) protein
MRRLEVITGPATGESIEVEGELVIGRQDADLTIPDPELSRQHALVRPVDEGIVVEDLGSLNGTFLNDVRIEGAVTLASDATLRVGRSEISVSIELERVPAETTVSPPPAARGSVRRIDEDPEPVAAVSHAAPPPADAVAAPAGPPPATGSHEPSANRRPRWLLPAIGIALLVVAGLVTGLVLALGGGDETQSHDLKATMSLARLRAEGLTETLAGEQTGPPAGPGTAAVELTFGAPPQQEGPIPITGTTTSRFDGGTYHGTFEGTVAPKPDGNADVTGTGTITGGTGAYENATGQFTLGGTVDLATNSARLTVEGSIDY